MSVDADAPGKHGAKNTAFMNKLQDCIAKGPLKNHCAVGGFSAKTHRSEIKNIIRRIRGQLDVLDSAVTDASCEGLNVVSDRACQDIRELLCELQDATGAIVRQEGAYGKEHGRR